VLLANPLLPALPPGRRAETTPTHDRHGVDPQHNRAERRAVRPADRRQLMGQAIPRQHPAVVLRSHYNHLRALLAVAIIAVVGLTAAAVILASNDDAGTGAGSVSLRAPVPAGDTRHDGGPEEGTRGALTARQPGVPYDRGPEEATAALTRPAAPATFDPDSIKQPPGVRYDGGPEEGTRGAVASDAPSNAAPGTRYDGAPRKAPGAPASRPYSADGGGPSGRRARSL
jgi:hypothetical protein